MMQRRTEANQQRKDEQRFLGGGCGDMLQEVRMDAVCMSLRKEGSSSRHESCVHVSWRQAGRNENRHTS